MSEDHNRPPPGWLLTVAFVILWLFAAYAVFYLVQKPFDQDFAWAIGNAILDVLLSLCIVLLGTALGRRLSTLFPDPGPGPGRTAL